MKIIASGIVPIAKYKGEYYILLGQERHIKNWEGDLKYCSFGGMREAGETIRQTAAREGYEESMGFLGTQNELLRMTNKTHPKYIDSVSNEHYRMYIIQIDYE